MVVLSLAVFISSLLGVITLFIIKRREVRTGIVFAPRMHNALDAYAHRIRDLLMAASADIEKAPQELLFVGRAVVKALALTAARGAQVFEAQLHRVADFVSYKHRFERPAPRSEFLSKIAEHKNGNGVGEAGNTPASSLEEKG